jgi:beta-glucosidase
VAPGDTDRLVDDGDDLAERLADPVLAAARAVAPPAGALPDVWGRLVEGLVDEPGPEDHAGPGPTGGGGQGVPDRADQTRDGGAGSAPVADAAVEARARDLLDQMTVHEKQHLLAGDVPFARSLSGVMRPRHDTLAVAGALPRLGVPGIRCSDGPGAAHPVEATVFPAPVARAATFDPDLETRVGDAIGAERRALGANLYAGVCADVVRHPAWRRAHEAYGEDPHLVSEMAPALVRGVQRHVMACVRYLACGSTVRDGHRVDVAVDDDDLRDIYLPPFRRCVDEGVAAVMTAAHSLDGVPCGHHHHLISTVLKGEWGFDGFVVTDFAHGARSARAVAAGLDLEMPFCWRFRGLGRLVRQGRVSPDRVDDAALRLLRQQVRAAARVHGHRPCTHLHV